MDYPTVGATFQSFKPSTKNSITPQFLPYDHRTKAFLSTKVAIQVESEDFKGYELLLKRVSNETKGSYSELSHAAFRLSAVGDNQTIADVLEEDLSMPSDEWKERVKTPLASFFQGLTKAMAENDPDLDAPSIYERPTEQAKKGYICLAKISWKVPNTNVSEIRPVEMFAQLGEYQANGVFNRSILWGAGWWGSDGEAEQVVGKLKAFLPDVNVYKQAEPFFGGADARAVCQSLAGEMIRTLKDDIKKMIVNDLTALAKRIRSYEKQAIKEEFHYTKEMALKEAFLSEARFDEIIEAIHYKKNVILQGPPGSGKTFLACRLAYTILGQKDSSRLEMIQFHQSYSYEDFVQGFRPTQDGNFQLKNGVFYEFVKRARGDIDWPYFFIIDEINRANLSKVFGELMMLIECDKRGPEFAVPLTYSNSSDDKLYIPENVYIIGTMNTADRSITIVDYALRRRFLFIDLKPEFGNKFRAFIAERGVEDSIAEEIVSRVSKLNEMIAGDDKSLGPGFQIGHSYFCPTSLVKDVKTWYNRIVEFEIKPLLKEYWFDDLDKADSQANTLYL